VLRLTKLAWATPTCASQTSRGHHSHALVWLLLLAWPPLVPYEKVVHHSACSCMPTSCCVPSRLHFPLCLPPPQLDDEAVEDVALGLVRLLRLQTMESTSLVVHMRGLLCTPHHLLGTLTGHEPKLMRGGSCWIMSCVDAVTRHAHLTPLVGDRQRVGRGWACTPSFMHAEPHEITQAAKAHTNAIRIGRVLHIHALYETDLGMMQARSTRCFQCIHKSTTRAAGSRAPSWHEMMRVTRAVGRRGQRGRQSIMDVRAVK